MPTNARKDNIHVCAEKSSCLAELSMKKFYTLGASLFPRMDGLLLRNVCIIIIILYIIFHFRANPVPKRSKNKVTESLPLNVNQFTLKMLFHASASKFT